MGTVDISDAKLKLARAREHISDLEARITSFLATDFYRLRAERDQGTGTLQIFFDSLHQPTKEVNSVIGDVISNLRSALDYALVALIAPMTGKPESIGFPFADNVNGFSGEVRKALSVCSQTIRNYFVSEVQAYETGRGHSLWVLNKLRNIDKHRFLIATTQLAGFFVSMRVGPILMTDCAIGFVAGQSGTFIQTDSNVEFTDQPRPRFEIRIDEPRYVPETPAVTFLKSLAGDVEAFLNAFEALA